MIHAAHSVVVSESFRLSVQRLQLTQFRNYASVSVKPEGHSVILTGANGAGKTNLLEAISLLMPGRGMRSVKLSQIQSTGGDARRGWGVAMQIEGATGAQDFGTGQENAAEEKRVLRLDGMPLKSQSELARHFAVLWQTPQMDNLFTLGQTERRQYFDRLCTAFTPDHATQLARYDYLRRERSRLLALPRADAAWLTSLERKMAEATLSLAATRREVAQVLTHAMRDLHPSFPQAQLGVHGFAETALQHGALPAVEIEEQLAAKLSNSRVEDARSGRASQGAHKMELEVMFAPKKVEAAQCSTGEQKALLLSLLLAQTQAMQHSQRRLPILLLDEVVAHLDKTRRRALFETLAHLGAQTWMTGTDATLFDDFAQAQHYRVENGAVS